METRDDVRELIMLGYVIELLPPALTSPGAIYVDCTSGFGGYARTVLEVVPSTKLIGIDRDPDALTAARERPDPSAGRAALTKTVYDGLLGTLADLGADGVHMVSADLGLSSLQIDREERGFAYRVDAPFGMRMSRGEGRSVAGLPNFAPPVELVRILCHYDEERFAERVVVAVMKEREIRPLKSSGRLVEVISNAIPTAAGHSPGYPTKRTFQVLRIAVNDELATLERFLPAATTALAPEGQLVMLPYHSLGDRPVKRHLAALAVDGVSRDMSVVFERLKPRFKLLTRGAERPPEQEIRSNPHAAPARLRTAAWIEEAQLSALATEVEQSTRESSRPRLRFVPPVKARVSTSGSLLILAILVVLGVALVVVVTTQIETQSRDPANLRKEATQLSYEAATRHTELQRVSGNRSLALCVSELGMAPNLLLAFVDLSMGTILGQFRPVKGDGAPYLIGRSGTRQSLEPASSESVDPRAGPAPIKETTPVSPASAEEASPQMGEGER